MFVFKHKFHPFKKKNFKFKNEKQTFQNSEMKTEVFTKFRNENNIFAKKKKKSVKPSWSKTAKGKARNTTPFGGLYSSKRHVPLRPELSLLTTQSQPHCYSRSYHFNSCTRLTLNPA